MDMRIALVPGDGIGPDIVREAVRVLDRIGEIYGHGISYTEIDAGGISIDRNKVPLTPQALEKAAASDAVLLGAVGGPKWDAMPGELRPEKALLGLRSGLGLFCNFRPAVLYPELAGASPLKESTIAGGVDLLVVRELTGGIYFGEKGRSEDGQSAYDVMRYTAGEIERIAIGGALNDTFSDDGSFLRASSGGRKLIVLDEADNFFGNADRGASTAVAKLIRESSQPVILIGASSIINFIPNPEAITYGVTVTGQSTGTVTFTCITTPTEAVTGNLVIINGG